MSTFSRLRRIRRTAGIGAVLALFAIPAIAVAGNSSPARTNLAGPGGYCQNVNLASAPSVGKVQISTTTAASPGFHAVHVDVKVNGGKLADGTYDVYLMNLYRGDDGQVNGCSASVVSSTLTVKNHSGVSFQGTATRYTGTYELQVYVGPIGGPGYASAPATIDVQ